MRPRRLLVGFGLVALGACIVVTDRGWAYHASAWLTFALGSSPGPIDLKPFRR